MQVKMSPLIPDIAKLLAKLGQAIKQLRELDERIQEADYLPPDEANLYPPVQEFTDELEEWYEMLLNEFLKGV